MQEKGFEHSLELFSFRYINNLPRLSFYRQGFNPQTFLDAPKLDGA